MQRSAERILNGLSLHLAIPRLLWKCALVYIVSRASSHMCLNYLFMFVWFKDILAYMNRTLCDNCIRIIRKNVERSVLPDFRSIYIPEDTSHVEICACWNSVQIWSYIYIYIQVYAWKFSWNFNPNTLGTRSAAGWRPHYPCYCPTVFFLHLHLIALPFLQGKIGNIKRVTFSIFLLFIKQRIFKASLTCNCVSQEVPVLETWFKILVRQLPEKTEEN